MVRFVTYRLVGISLSLFATITLTFLILHVVPGDPAEAALSQSTAPQDVLELRREALGLNLPLPAQYGRFLLNLARGDLGISWFAGQPVGFLMSQQIGATVNLALAGMAIALATGGSLGILAAARGYGWLADTSRSVAGLLLSVPVMFSGTLVIWLFAVQLDWFPATGQGGVRYICLPALVVGIGTAGSIARVVDAGVSEARRQLFMRTALAKGRSYRQALWRHALRVGILPALDVVALQFGYLLGGTVITESVFARQGLGRLLTSAVLDKDIPVVQGVVLLSALLYGVLNFLADVAHAWLDPRIRFDN